MAFRYLVLIVGVIVFSAIASPIVMSFILEQWPQATWPFSRIFDRVFVVALVVALILLRRELRLGGVRQALLQSPGSPLVRFGMGFVVAMLVASLAIWLLFAQGVLLPESLREFSWRYLFMTLSGALVIGVLEEIIFRAIIFSQIRDRLGLWWGVMLSSVMYSAVHFIVPKKSFSYDLFDPTAGFRYVAEILTEPLADSGIRMAVIGLFLVGVTFALLYEKSRSIYLCIGMHCAWVCVIKFVPLFSQFGPMVDLTKDLVRRNALVMQPVSWIFAVIGGIILLVLFRTTPKPLAR